VIEGWERPLGPFGAALFDFQADACVLRWHDLGGGLISRFGIWSFAAVCWRRLWWMSGGWLLAALFDKSSSAIAARFPLFRLEACTQSNRECRPRLLSHSKTAR